MKGIVCPRCRNLITKVVAGPDGVRVDYPDVVPAKDGSNRYFVKCAFDTCGHEIPLERVGEVAYDSWPYRTVLQPA